MAVAISTRRFEPAGQDLGNIIELGHVNTHVTDQIAALAFYVTGIGLTRDPFLPPMQHNNMWVNVGRSQFHLPTMDYAEVVRGVTGIIVPGRERMLQRLKRVEKDLSGTKFAVQEHASHVDLISPWGNRIRVHEPDPACFGARTLGMPYVEFDTVPAGSLDGILRFYREVVGALAALERDAVGPHVRVTVGEGQALIYRETENEVPRYDGHHVMVTVADYAGLYARFSERGLVTKESTDPYHQYRFQDIVDPKSGAVLFTVEHEIRSIRHAQYGRPLLNRNPDQAIKDYAPGRDEWQV